MSRVIPTAISLLAIFLCSCASAAEIRLFDYKGGGWIELNGRIVEGDATKIASALKSKNWTSTALYFNSSGGDALEGIRIGLLARTMGFSTVVGNRLCASACALAWSGGTTRLMMPGARVGYHSTYTLDEKGSPLRSQEGNAVVRSYVALIGLPATAFQIMIHAQPDQILWLNEKIAEISGLKYYQLDQTRDVIPFSQK